MLFIPTIEESMSDKGVVLFHRIRPDLLVRIELNAIRHRITPTNMMENFLVPVPFCDSDK
jgi:hypothetical protein